MKKIIKTAAILLILAGGFYSCRKDKEGTDAPNVPYAPCPCEMEEVIGIKLPETAWLFADSVPELMSDGSIFEIKVSYYATFNYNKPHERDRTIVYLCNFPDFAKNDIPPRGCEIYLSGKLYNKCFELPHYDFERRFFMVLTNLKLK
jgi:hypothetical protein